ncbi:MAG: starch [Geobacteraceae bacterium]|nr:MAG: starch [Geobacteraceae bacterium]
MKILVVASEVAPFAKTGGLADVTGSLPKEIKQRGHDVRIIIPFYKTVAKGGFPIRKGRKSVEVALGGTTHKGLLRQTSLADIPVYLLENKEYFHRDFLYGTPAGEYPDNARRFAFFCRGVLDILKKMDFRPDVIHCHDWQTALIPILLKYEFNKDPFFEKTAVLFTIHNLAYQGLFPRKSLAEMGLAPSYFTMERLEYYGQVNLMKGGILTADLINTVSTTYCKEMQTPEHGCGLDGVLQTRSDDLSGILNGLDYTEWDPATDRHILKNYKSSALAGKAVNKKGLQKLLGLEQKRDIPLLGMVSRLTEQKGVDLLVELLPQFEAEKLQLVVLGTGDARYIKLLQDFQRHGAKNVSLNIGFRPELSPMVYAGSDMFLMPSRYEPCGLGQLMALRYGAVPVVRKTGGLTDTISDFRDDVKEPNGFTFDEYSAEAFWDAIMRAVHVFGDRAAWVKIVRRGMNCDFSWQRSAEKYEELYLRGVAIKKG